MTCKHCGHEQGLHGMLGKHPCWATVSGDRSEVIYCPECPGFEPVGGEQAARSSKGRLSDAVKSAPASPFVEADKASSVTPQPATPANLVDELRYGSYSLMPDEGTWGYELSRDEAIALVEKFAEDNRYAGKFLMGGRGLEQRIEEALTRYVSEPYLALDKRMCSMLAAHIARRLRGETDD